MAIENAREFFETLESRSDSSKAAGLTANYLFDIDGAGKWTVRVDNGDVSVEAAGRDGQVSVSVVDHGHGIAPEVAERLFSPFFSTKAEGMGMGLSICRTAIEFHGGTLTHAPNAGGGTVFTFSLPQQAQAQAA